MIESGDTRDFWESIHQLGRSVKWRASGLDGEERFKLCVFEVSKGKIVLDVGCGTGEFTAKIAEKARWIVGLDISPTAIKKSKTYFKKRKISNSALILCDAEHLPQRDCVFDIVYNRRGPANDSMKALKNVHSALRKNGIFVSLAIGEKDKQNIKEIFGRGQYYNLEGKMSDRLRTMLRVVGFSSIRTEEYKAKQYYANIKDIVALLESTPIIEDFCIKKDWPFLKRLEEKHITAQGIVTNVHRILIMATKEMPKSNRSFRQPKRKKIILTDD